MIPVRQAKLDSAESILEYGAAMDVGLVGLFRDLVRLETELWNRLEARVHKAHGVPLAWLEIMQVVDVTEGCRVLDIARALSITVGGASKVVDRVEAAGLCRRQPNPTDGRSNRIQLTEPGVGLLKAADVTYLCRPRRPRRRGGTGRRTHPAVCHPASVAAAPADAGSGPCGGAALMATMKAVDMVVVTARPIVRELR